MATYSRGAGKKVETAMHEMKEGKLKSGRNGKKVTNPKQAIAIGLSEARERGEKVPSKKSASKRSGSKTASKTARKGAAKTGRKTATKKTASKKGGRTATKKTASKSRK